MYVTQGCGIFLGLNFWRGSGGLSWGKRSIFRRAYIHCFKDSHHISWFMAVSFTIDGASDALRNLGFFCEQDPIVGARVAEITQKRIPFLSEDGLEFCQLNILNDEVRELGRVCPVYWLTSTSACDRFWSPSSLGAPSHVTVNSTVIPGIFSSSERVARKRAGMC